VPVRQVGGTEAAAQRRFLVPGDEQVEAGRKHARVGEQPQRAEQPRLYV